MTRTTETIQTRFSTDGLDAVMAAFERCADPANCGSEFAAGADVGHGDEAVDLVVVCTRCGRSGTIPAAGLAEGSAA
ncbi:hypothetical protein ACRAWG_32620 [Methylobacterium sp. P31]